MVFCVCYVPAHLRSTHLGWLIWVVALFLATLLLLFLPLLVLIGAEEQVPAHPQAPMEQGGSFEEAHALLLHELHVYPDYMSILFDGGRKKRANYKGLITFPIMFIMPGSIVYHLHVPGSSKTIEPTTRLYAYIKIT